MPMILLVVGIHLVYEDGKEGCVVKAHIFVFGQWSMLNSTDAGDVTLSRHLWRLDRVHVRYLGYMAGSIFFSGIDGRS